MLTKTSVWRGAIDEAYRTQVEEWVTAHKQADTVTKFIDLENFGTKLIAEEGIEALGLGGEFFDLFPSEQAIIIKNVDKWAAPDVKKLVTYLQKMESPLIVAFTHVKDSAAIKAIKDVADEDFDFIVPKENPALGEWIVNYFEKNDSGIPKQDAFKLAEFCGESRELVVSISKTAIASSLGRPINWQDNLSKIVTKMGFVAPYKITGAISKGDIANAIEILTRVLDGGMAPLAILGMLRKRYQSYITALNYSNPQAFVKESGGNPYAAKYLYAEAKTLGGARIARSLQSILTTDSSLKGGITGIPPAAVMEILVIELTKQFRLANRR
jgi:DNA polymerase III delta subunit